MMTPYNVIPLMSSITYMAITIYEYAHRYSFLKYVIFHIGLYDVHPVLVTQVMSQNRKCPSFLGLSVVTWS